MKYDSFSVLRKSICGLAILAGVFFSQHAWAQFIDNADGTVTNPVTGLMWQQETAPGLYMWREAYSYCAGLSLAGYTDWRLPSVRELMSLVNLGKSRYPFIDISYFPDTTMHIYWSSTTFAHTAPYAWGVNLYYGYPFIYGKQFIKNVRAVRGANPACLAVYLLGEDDPGLAILRQYRDEHLAASQTGIRLIAQYYEKSDEIITLCETNPAIKVLLKNSLEDIIRIIAARL